MPAYENRAIFDRLTAERFGDGAAFDYLVDVDLVIAEMIRAEAAVRPLVGMEVVAAEAILALSRAGRDLHSDALALERGSRPASAPGMQTRARAQLDAARALMTGLIRARGQ